MKKKCLHHLLFPRFGQRCYTQRRAEVEYSAMGDRKGRLFRCLTNAALLDGGVRNTGKQQ